MTAEHIKVERDCTSLWRMCPEFARGRMPAEILQAARIGRMTALQKLQGGIRGIVVGDFTRRVVARTLAQQLGPAVEHHTSPFQFTLSTRSGCECVAHIAQAMTDLDPIQWSELERSTSSRVRPCCRDSWRLVGETLPSLSCDNSTAPRHCICGLMTWASRTIYGKARWLWVIPSCPLCTLAANIAPSCT